MTSIEKAINEFFVERKFGIFVHWGLYSLLGGIWKSQQTPYIGEWIMKRCRIPVAEYEKRAQQFCPSSFDAEKWIDIVARSGARYFVFTAKHHDGFSMYRSDADKYNIIDASKFSIDPVEALSKACRKRDIKFCLYYSQDQDWHHPHGTGNDWDFDVKKKNFAIYFEEKVKPQVTELLTHYGPIGLIWFDTPQRISKQQSQELFDLVHQLQPQCLVNGRLGHGIGDYGQTEDNDIPAGTLENAWEVPVTINDTWGYKINDVNWKSSRVLIKHLIEVVSKGGNYLLNLGPDPQGVIPQESVNRVETIGKWLDVNGDAVFETKPTPFSSEFPWGYVTTNEHKLYLHVTDTNTDRIELTGLRTRIIEAYLLDRKSTPLKYKQLTVPDSGLYRLSIDLPTICAYTDPFVIVLEANEKIVVDNAITQQPDGKIILEAYHARIYSNCDDCNIKLGSFSSIQGWLNASAAMRWSFRVHTPGRFTVSVLTAAIREDGDPASPIHWDGGHRVHISTANHQISSVINEDFVQTSEGSYAKFIGSSIGPITFDSPGEHMLKIKPEKINSENGLGFTLRSIIISPMINSELRSTPLQLSSL